LCLRWNNRFAGREAGDITPSTGRWRIRFTDSADVRRYQVVWAMEHGWWVEAPFMIDHEDGDKLNDRLSNLRMFTAKENAQNKPATRLLRMEQAYDE
jgi:hypothetical protein